MRNFMILILFIVALSFIPGYSQPIATDKFLDVHNNWGSGKRKVFSSKANAKKEIRKVFVEEMTKYLDNIYGYPQFEKAILNFDVKKAAEILKKTLPLTKDEIKSGDSLKMLNAFSALIATQYILSDKEVFNAKLLRLLGVGYDFAYEHTCCEPYNVFSNAKLINTAELMAYWRWLNYDTDKGELKSTMLDYAPFTEKELSLLYWSHILFNWMKLEYKSEIATELVKLEIVELVDGKYMPTEKWSKKLEKDNFKDKFDNVESSVEQKYDLELKPWVCTLYILDRINNKPFESHDYGNLGGGGGPGGRSGRWREHGDWWPPRHKTIDETLIPQYEKEDLLDIEKVKELLNSKELEIVFRGVVHLFRHINQENDYSLLNLAIPAISWHNRQRYNYIVEQLNALSTKATKNNDDKNVKILKDFLLSLFTNENVNRPSIFLKVVVMTNNREYTEEIINQLFEYKIDDYDTQEAIIDYIVETNRKDLIPKLFEWAFSIKGKDKHIISEYWLIPTLVKLDRDKTLVYANKVLLKSENVNTKALKYLGEALFNEVTGEYFGENLERDEEYMNEVDEYIIDPKKLDDSELYFKNAYLYKDTKTKQAFYQSVAQNCSAKVDNTVFNWFRKETDNELKMVLLKCFEYNILKIKPNYRFNHGIDKETVDKKAKRNEILEKRHRFMKLVEIAMNEKSTEFDDYIMSVAKFLDAESAWSILEKLFDRYKHDERIDSYIYNMSYVSADDLNLVDYNSLYWNLCQYLIDNLTNEDNLTLIPEFFTTALSILSD